MKLSNKQKRGIERVTGKPWNSWHPEAIKAYFSFTDKGWIIEVPEEAKEDFNELMFCHHWHSTTIEIWKEDFRKGLLFPDDFLNQGYPLSYVKHALEIYRDAMIYIPIKYKELLTKMEVLK